MSSSNPCIFAFDFHLGPMSGPSNRVVHEYNPITGRGKNSPSQSLSAHLCSCTTEPLIMARLYRVGPAHLTRPGAWVPGLALGTRGSYWFNSADFISFSKKFTCWVLKGPTGQRSHGKAACRGVGVGEGGNITVSDSP